MDPLPSERKISERLLEICKAAPAKLQQIGEMFLTIRNPQRYGLLRPQGRNSWLQTKKGYPDAYAKDSDGVHIIEATVGNWRGHIAEEDSKRIPKLGKVGSYVLFALQSAESLIPQTNASQEKVDKNEEYFKDLLAGLGVPRDQIEFIFLDQLVSALRTPQYSWLLRDLELVSEVLPFECLDVITSANPAGPTIKEYVDESVICPEKLDRLYRTLCSSPLVVLTGLGGVGKTTAGLSLAYRWSNRNPAGAFYLDAKWFSGAMGGTLREALSAIEFYAGTQTLFVIDNVHLLQHDEIARIVHCAFVPSRSLILLLGRSFPHEMFGQLPATVRKDTYFENLSVAPSDLLAMYRLYAKHAIIHSHIPNPTEAQLAEWHKLAPDLVLFSASLRESRDALKAGLIPKVSKQQAVNYVKRQYVANLPLSERDSLIIIAKLAELEIPASIRSLGGEAPRWLISKELITQSSAANQQTQRYSLPHDNFGALILECFDVDTITTAWDSALHSDIFQATYVARRLVDLDDKATARTILLTHEYRIWQFTDSMPPSFAHTLDTLYERVQLTGTYPARLAKLYKNFVEGSDNFLAGARSFISFAQRHGYLPSQFHQILLSQTPLRVEVALKLASPIDFAYFIKLIKTQDKAIFDRHYPLVANENILLTFVNKFQDATLHEINQALGLIHANDPAIEGALQRLVSQQVPLAPLFEHLITGDVSELQELLQHQFVIELLATGDFLKSLAERVSRSFSRISWMIDRYSDAGLNVQALINDSLQLASSSNVIQKVNKSSANVLFYVLKGSRSETVIGEYIKHLKPTELSDLLLHWPLVRLESAWRSMQAYFGGTSVHLILNKAMQDSIWFKLKNNTEAGRYVAAAVNRYAWKLLRGDSSWLRNEIDPRLKENFAFLSSRLEEMKNRPGAEQFLIVALADTISELSD